MIAGSAPREVVHAARQYRSRDGSRRWRPVLIGITGGAIPGVVIFNLLDRQMFVWAVAVVLITVAATAALGAIYTSDWAIYRSCNKDFYRAMDRAGWCGWCHGPHLHRDCPDRKRVTP